jgi:predicted metal-dependent hydrolase
LTRFFEYNAGSERGAGEIETVPDACLEAAPPALWEGIAEFNRGQFFECHKTLEELWMAEPRPIRQLYQGILQIGVAFHHLRAGRHRPAKTLLVRGCAYLQPLAPTCLGVDIARLLGEARQCLTRITRLGAENLDDFDWSLVPRIVRKE